MNSGERRSVELLAPAGDLDAAYAAFHYGADAIYLGLKRFSARAEAANFSAGELSEIAAFAHAAEPRRSVYVAMNTLIQDRELDEAIESLALAAGTGADALIVQDLGVLRLARRHFPSVALHASTQMAIHNLEGAKAARELGFSRVTLARELTLEEIAGIVREAGIEVETFIHGALCYSYSGLCLYSSMLRGRSGNRGACTYPCRECFTPEGGGEGAYAFSMKDLAARGDAPALRDAGVRSLKIEGRKKSALYVATTTDYYRKLLDGRLKGREQEAAEEAIKTVFSRPWTSLYVKSRRNRDVIDAEVVGHRGVPIGTVETGVRQDAPGWVRFKTRRRLERHDGLQIDVPGEGRPFGFAIDHLRPAGVMGRSGEPFEVPANTLVEVPLPPEHPAIPAGAPIYCSSSQEVKQRYRFPRPKPGLFRVRHPVDVTVTLRTGGITAEAVTGRGDEAIRVSVERDGALEPARDAGQVEALAGQSFAKLGDTAFVLGTFTLHNDEGRFVAVSVLNRVRRDLLGRAAVALEKARVRRIERIRSEEGREAPLLSDRSSEARTERVGDNAFHPGDGGCAEAEGAKVQGRLAAVEWSIKVDRLAHLEALDDADWQAVSELAIDIERDPLPDLLARAAEYAGRIGRDRVRLALPVVTRAWERADLCARIEGLRGAGWDRWEAANVSAWRLLGRPVNGDRSGMLSTDWSVYVANRAAARQVLDMGVSQFVLAPDDDPANVRALLAGFGAQAVVPVYQDTPLFISENCAQASLAGRCPVGRDCREAETVLVSGSGERVRAVQKGCRSILIAEPAPEWRQRLHRLMAGGAVRLRAAFINRHYRPADVAALWRAMRDETGRGRPNP